MVIIHSHPSITIFVRGFAWRYSKNHHLLVGSSMLAVSTLSDATPAVAIGRLAGIPNEQKAGTRERNDRRT